MSTTGERNTLEREGRVFSHALAANTSINKGAMVVLDAGAAKPGFANNAVVAVGIAEHSAATADGATHIRCKLGTFLFVNSVADPVEAADVGSPCFIVDDETVAASDGAGTRSKAGTVRSLDGGGVWVEFA